MPASTVKQTVVFSRPQLAALKDEAARLGVSWAELLRRIVDAWRENRFGTGSPGDGGGA